MYGQSHDDARRDAERLAALEAELARKRAVTDRPALGDDRFHQASQAWRMVIELVTGLAIGFAIGYGLDRLLGTLPILLVVFTLLGLAAGIRTMLGTARELTGRPGAPGPDEGNDERGR